MAESPKFKVWVNRQLATGPTPEEKVSKDMEPANLKVEVREQGVWKEMKG